jgi:hypothetical protein
VDARDGMDKMMLNIPFELPATRYIMRIAYASFMVRKENQYRSPLKQHASRFIVFIH